MHTVGLRRAIGIRPSRMLGRGSLSTPTRPRHTNASLQSQTAPSCLPQRPSPASQVDRQGPSQPLAWDPSQPWGTQKESHASQGP